MTKAERDELRRLAEAAGKVEVHPAGADDVTNYLNAAAAAVPDLLDEVERLRALLKEVEWAEEYPGSGTRCPICHIDSEFQGGNRHHEPGCRLDAELKGEPPAV